MIDSMTYTWLLLTILLVLIYIFLLNQRLRQRHPLVRANVLPPKSDWDKLADYTHINMLDHLPRKASQRGYIVVGASGMLGTQIVKMLLLRGERHIRMADISPPSDETLLSLLSQPGLEYLKTDITDPDSVAFCFGKAFEDGTKPSIVLSTAAAIRFWERHRYLYHLSHRINVQGTQNMLDAAAASPDIDTFIYTSSAAVGNKKVSFAQLGLDLTSEEDFVAREGRDMNQDHHYPATKRIADALVRNADGKGGVRTSVLRPGMIIFGVKDFLAWGYLSMAYSSEPAPTVHTLGDAICQHAINSQDLATAHILAADALGDPLRVEKIAGQGFFITGDPKLYSFADLRILVNHFSARKVPFSPIQPIVVFILGHILEAILWVRWHLLRPFYGPKLRPTPPWLGIAESMQPSMLATALSDVYIDDREFRETLGWTHAWSTPQSVRWVIDEFERMHTPPKNGDKQQSMRPWGGRYLEGDEQMPLVEATVEKPKR